ncbi:MAG: hypothetical protein IH845_04070 [Nanoarchaeota archaeon]|nr:hypothetical protein [Nanoarchaeota archaeon]
MVEAMEAKVAYGDLQGDPDRVMVPFDFEKFRSKREFTDRLDTYFRDPPGTHPFLDAAYGFSNSKYGRFLV